MNHMINCDTDLATRNLTTSHFGSMRKKKKRPQSTILPPVASLEALSPNAVDEALGSLKLEKWFKDLREDLSDVPLEVARQN